ncbi:hypothetical protein MMC07_008382 [Pseudocyphellaria aurata]|nr:hypothetical protein [Pseudocyphellaria aurata]
MASSESPPFPDTSLRARIIALIVVSLCLNIIVVALRIATRRLILKRIGWDDWTIILALIGQIMGFALVSVELQYGFGRHQSYLNDHQLQEFNKYGYGEWIQTFITLMWTKVSICLFLLPIPNSKALIRPLQAAIVFLILSHVILTLLWILQCLPVAAAWDLTIHGKCFSKGQKERIIIAQAVISAVSDFAFASYPILILWKVQLKRKTKIGLCCLMGLGVITGVCCIVRTVLNYQSIPADITYGGITNWYWRSVEATLGIVAACIPPLWPGYKWLSDALSRTFKRGTPGDRVPLTTNNPHMRKNNNNAGLALPSRPISESTTAGSAQDLRTTQIMKTTRIDIEKGPGMEPTNIECKPSLEINLGSPLMVDRLPKYELWLTECRRNNLEDLRFETVYGPGDPKHPPLC